MNHFCFTLVFGCWVLIWDVIWLPHLLASVQFSLETVKVWSLFSRPSSRCDPNWYRTVVTSHVTGAPVHAMLLEERSGHYSQAVTDIDGHMYWHATNKGSRQRKRQGGRTQYQWLFTVATITARTPHTPLPHRHTHPHAPTRLMHLPAKIRPECENTFPEISVTYICEQTRSQACADTHTLKHKLMLCQSSLVFIVFISCCIVCLF